MVLLEGLVENFLLEADQLLVIDVTIIIGVCDPENSQESFLESWSESLCPAVVQWGCRIEDSILSARDDVIESEMLLG